MLALLGTCLGAVSLTVWSMKFYYLEDDPPCWLKRLVTGVKSVSYCPSEQSNIERTKENSHEQTSDESVTSRQLSCVRPKSNGIIQALPLEPKPQKQEISKEMQSNPVNFLSVEDENKSGFSNTPCVNENKANALDILSDEQLSAGSETSNLKDEKSVSTWKSISESLDRIYFITFFIGISLLNIILIASLANRDSSFYNQH